MTEMDYSKKESIVNELQKAMGNKSDGRFINPDGRYIDERIAFEFWTDDEKEALCKTYGSQEEAIEKERQKIIDEQRKQAKLKEAVKKISQARRDSNTRKGEQFWTNPSLKSK